VKHQLICEVVDDLVHSCEKSVDFSSECPVVCGSVEVDVDVLVPDNEVSPGFEDNYVFPKIAILSIDANGIGNLVSAKVNELVSWRLIHAKLGHIRKASLQIMAKHGMLLGLRDEDIDWRDTQSCEICARANIKQHRLPRHSDLEKLKPFQKGFVDLYGPIYPESIGGNKYVMMYCDSQSSFGMLHLTKSKKLSELESAFKYWIVTANSYGFKMEVINADSDSIFENIKLVEYLADHGISIRYAPPGQHGKNGIIERMIQTAWAMAKAMLIASYMQSRFWSYAMDYAMIIYDAILKTKFKNDKEYKYKSPYTIIADDTPVFNFPIFGCEVIARNPKALQLPKIVSRGRRGAFLGFDAQHDNCIVYLNVETNVIGFTDDYELFEDYYGVNHMRTNYYGQDYAIGKLYKKLQLNRFHPFKHGLTKNRDRVTIRENENVFLPRDEDYDNDVSDEDEDFDAVAGINDDDSDEMDYWIDDAKDSKTQYAMNFDYSETVLQGRPNCGNDSHSENSDFDQEIQDGYEDFDEHDDETMFENTYLNFMKIRVEDKPTYTDRYDEAMERLLNGYDMGYKLSDILANVMMLNVHTRIIDGAIYELPQTLQEAMNSVYWDAGFRDSSKSELSSIFETNTFWGRLYEQDELPDGIVPVDHKWLFDVKPDAFGHIKKFKTRIVTRGFKQQLYQSYNETYSPTAMKDSVRIILAMSAMYDLVNFQWDFKTAFLNGELEDDEVIYSPVFEGYELFDIYKEHLSKYDGKKLRDWIASGKRRKLFLRMRKSAYGTKQASRTWYKLLNGWMIAHGYTPVNGDPSLYYKRDGDSFILVSVYVDDIFGVSTDPEEIRILFQELRKDFEVNDLGRIHQCLGMVVNYTEDGMILNNEIYINNLLKEFDMENCNWTPTPSIPNEYFGPKDCMPRENYDPERVSRFRKLVGSCMWSSISWRFDIFMKTSHLARFVEFPSDKIFKAGYRILKYLKKTSKLGIKFKRVQHYPNKIQPLIIAMSDSNYAGDLDGISISSYVLQLTDQYYWDHLDVATPVEFNMISFISKRQREVGRSTAEPEYISAALTVKNILHKKYMFDEMGFVQPTIPLFLDNTAVKFMASEWRVTENTKHINTRYHFLRFHVIKETVAIYYVPSEENIADLGTKPLPIAAHEYLTSKIMEEVGFVKTAKAKKRKRVTLSKEVEIINED